MSTKKERGKSSKNRSSANLHIFTTISLVFQIECDKNFMCVNLSPMNYEVSARRANRMRCVGKNNWIGVERGWREFEDTKRKSKHEELSNNRKKMSLWLTWYGRHFSSFPYLYLIKTLCDCWRGLLSLTFVPITNPFCSSSIWKSTARRGIIFKHLIEYYRMSACRIYWHFTWDL